MVAHKENPIAVFLAKNGLKQIELADFLGVHKSNVSTIANGHARIPQSWLFRLQNNKNGWDISMLPGIAGQEGNTGVIVNGDNVNSPVHQDNRQYFSDSPDVLRATIDLLEERIKEKDAQIKEKDAQIKEKDAQINRLLNILESSK